jgi:hypothetical protein
LRNFRDIPDQNDMSAAINVISISEILWTRMTGHALNFSHLGAVSRMMLTFISKLFAI